MKKLLITLLLASPFSFADWGDVYYCQMTNNSGITVKGEKENYILEKFTFKLDEPKQSVVFGKGGYFKGWEVELEEEFSWPSQEVWYAGNYWSTAYLAKGKFLYVRTGVAGNVSLSADCDKF